MLGYEWPPGNHSPPPPPPPPQHLILTDHDPSSSGHHHRPIFEDPFSSPCTFPHNINDPSSSYNTNTNLSQPQFPLFHVDPRAYPSAYQPHPMLTTNLDAFGGGPPGSFMVPKAEPEYTNRIGLNLGGRTYFAAADDDLVSRLYRRSRPAAEVVNSPRCQAEGCNADLSHAKHYHRRHKVCEFHSKASTVIAAGLTQRFCQQCSRFHLLSEFDNGKRSCRKRLADHNRRRRKSNQSTPQDQRSQVTQTSPSQSIQRSPSDSGANSSSSVTIAVSSSCVSFDCNFRQRLYE